MLIFFFIFLLLALVAMVVVIRKRIRPWLKKLVLLLGTIFLQMIFLGLFLFPPFGQISSGVEDQVQTTRFFLKRPCTEPAEQTESGLREFPVCVWMPKTLPSTPLPVVLYSPGAFGGENANTILCETIASNGYMVLAMSHPYHSISTKLSDGRSIPIDLTFMKDVMTNPHDLPRSAQLSRFRTWVGMQVGDMTFLLDALQNGALPEAVQKNIDARQIFLSGHSLGGAAALEIGRKRASDLKGVIALESPYFCDILDVNDNQFRYVQEDYPLPVLNIYSDALWPRLPNMAGTEYDTNVKMLNHPSEKWVSVHIEGAGHLGLSDLRNVSPIGTKMLDGFLDTAPYKEVVAKINAAALAFLLPLTNPVSQ